MNVETKDNPERSRFEAEVGGDFAWVSYRLKDDEIVLTYSEVPEPLRGRGIGEQVVLAALESARERGLKVVPLCSFVADVLRRHPEYADLDEKG